MAAEGIGARVVSVPSLELFDAQPQTYRDEVIPPTAKVVTVEAGSTQPWRYLAGRSGACIGIDRFGASAPDKLLAKVFGLTVDNVVATARRVLAGFPPERTSSGRDSASNSRVTSTPDG